MSLGEKLTKILTLEILKSQILEYFTKATTYRQVDNILLCPINPTDVLNLPYDVPALSNIVEIIPYVKEINSVTGAIIVGWNFFVEGMHRFDLGTTKFDDFNNMAMALKSGGYGYQSKIQTKLLVKDIIKFILITIKKHDVEIDIDAKRIDKSFYGHVGDGFLKSIGSPGASGKMYMQNRYMN